MMLRDNRIFKKNLSATWPDLLLIGFIFYVAFVYVKISGNRYFNFDEFEILYTGASIVRGKVLYADRIEPHFPLFNICIAYLVGLCGFKATTIIITRYVILFTNLVALIFVYKIGEILWDKRTGLLAVCFTLSSIVFLNKGIEIRHDVFNMTFNVIGAYYGLRYIKEKERYRYIILSGVFLGIAFASTQKALVWNIGIIGGLSLYYLRNRSYNIVWRINVLYFIMVLAPLIITLIYLIIRYDENISMFLRFAIADQLNFYAPHTKELYPFPYNRYDLFKDLIFQNHLLYALGIGGIFSLVILWVRDNTERIVIVVWALIGVLFYVTAKRPFFQTFLPSVPPVSILAAGLIADMFNDFKSLAINKRIGVGISAIVLLFIWPLCLVCGQKSESPKMMRQMANVSFCLKNLKKDDKVLCFTQNQIFYDPVFKVNWKVDEKPIYNYEAIFVEQVMIKQQCKVIINDYRTRLLNEEIKERIGKNYLPIKTGDILIPGFKIEPKQVFDKKIWIEGYYYSPTVSLEIDGKKIESNLVKLEQKKYRIANNSNRQVFMVYIFDRDKFIKGSSDYLGLMKRM